MIITDGTWPLTKVRALSIEHTRLVWHVHSLPFHLTPSLVPFWTPICSTCWAQCISDTIFTRIQGFLYHRKLVWTLGRFHFRLHILYLLKEKRKRSDSVLGQNPLYQQKSQTGKVTIQTTQPKMTITQRNIFHYFSNVFKYFQCFS